MPDEKITVLCPACKSRMSVRQIIHAIDKHTDEFVYHCAMCDIELKQLAPQRLHEPVAPIPSIRDPFLAT
jgi:hypothetical protein